MISGFRTQKLPWGLGDLWYLSRSSKWLRIALVVACWVIFIIVPSSITSLLGPVPFDKTANLEGTELDFSSSAADCITWLNNAAIPNLCGWETYGGVNFTTCLGENQLVDVLEAGRGNILSLVTNNLQSIDYSQLGALNGLKFLGPIQGVLPMGPNGVPAFNTVDSPIIDLNSTAGIISYNYTLNTQGLNSKVSCEYAQQTPIQAYGVTPESIYTIQYNGTCDGAVDVLTASGVPNFITPNSNNGLMYWACKSLPSAQELSYSIYLSGRGLYYSTEVGNITCTVSPLQPAIFPLTYQSVPSIFSSARAVEFGTATSTLFLDQVVVALGALVEEAQNQQDNLVASSVFTFGAKAFNLTDTDQNPGYLPLYEAMIQGVMEYLGTYARLLISTNERPDSCNRKVTGTLTYRVLGWTMKPEHIGFLMPLTIVNLAALVIMILAILGTKSGSYTSDPLDAKTLVSAEHYIDTSDPNGWKDRLTYRDRPREVDGSNSA